MDYYAPSILYSGRAFYELEKYEDTEVIITRKDITDNPSLANRGGEAVNEQSGDAD